MTPRRVTVRYRRRDRVTNRTSNRIPLSDRRRDRASMTSNKVPVSDRRRDRFCMISYRVPVSDRRRDRGQWDKLRGSCT